MDKKNKIDSKIDLTEDMIFSKKDKKKTEIILIKHNVESSFLTEMRHRDWKEGYFCDCCGEELNPFNRNYNLCLECDKKLSMSLKKEKPVIVG